MLKFGKHFKFIKIAACLFIMATAIFLLSNFALAAGANLGLNYPAGTGLSNNTDIRIIIANIIRVALGFLGIIAVALIMYGGWLWMTSGGNEEKIRQAKEILKNAVIGLIIIFSAFAIATFILSRLIDATGGGQGIPGGGSDIGGGIGTAGGEVVDYTFPANGQTNVPRNLIRAAAVLNEPVDPNSFKLSEGETMDTFRAEVADIQVYTVEQTPIDLDYRSSNLAAKGFGGLIKKIQSWAKIVVKNLSGEKALAADAGAEAAIVDFTPDVSADGRTLIFSLPRDKLLGSPTATVWYSVTLKKGIKKINSTDSIFSDLSGDVGYNWRFAVGTEIDNTPPKIISVIPYPRLKKGDGSIPGSEPRNVAVQINFSEAIDPTSASGKTENGFKNIVVSDNADTSMTPVPGIFYISNQYRTVEFLTLDDCGINSCGNTIYCLPADKQLKVFAKAATLVSTDAPSAIFTASGYNGVVDMAGNSLDGNANGQAQGPQAQSSLAPYYANKATHEGEGDDYYWIFNTNSTIDTEVPVVNSVTPAQGAGDAELTAIPQAVFSKLLLSSSIDKPSVQLRSGSSTSPFYWLYENNVIDEPVSDLAPTTGRTTVYVGHNIFQPQKNYSVQLNSGIKDIYQNCYYPCSGLTCTGSGTTPCCCNGTATSGTRCW